MCLAIPMKVIEINDNSAKVEIAGTSRIVGLDIIEPKPKVGDYVIVHAGFVIQIIDPDEAELILNDFKEMSAYESEIC
jgi:hydrogenase expression/formation protein HypC